MSKKYQDKISQGTGYSSIQFECDYGLKLLKKMGWNQGQGLGVQEDGMKECIQVKRRNESLGLGVATKEFKWNNNWWENTFNSAIKNLRMEINSSSGSEEEEEDHSKHPKLQKLKKVEALAAKRKSKGNSTQSTSSSESEDEESESENNKKKTTKIIIQTKKIKKEEIKVSVKSKKN